MAARIRRKLLARAVGALVVCCLVVPAIASAEEKVPHVTSLTADPGAVKVSETTKITVAVSPLSLGYHVYVVNTETGQAILGCPTVMGTCSGEVTIPWSENSNPKDLHLVAEVVPKSGSPTGNGTPLTVDVQRFEWNISLKASKNPVTVGESTKLEVDGIDPSTAWTGYHLKIFNDETDELLTNCWGHECWRTLSFPYSMQQDAGPIPIHAEVVRETPPYDVAGQADYTLYVDPIRFGVDMSFSEPVTEWNGERTWLATVSASPALYGTPFFTSIVTSTGGTAGSCALWVTCSSHRLGPGTFRAIVKDEKGTIYAATPWWTVPAGSAPSEPQEETADGLDLLALAAMFPSATAACNAILFLPGTHLANSSVTDQYLACDAAVSAGASTAAALRAAAAAAGGTSILWLLWEEQTKEQTDPAQFETEEEPEEPEPIPVPPIVWPGGVVTDAETLEELNPEKVTQREARVTIKQCQRLVTRASMPNSRCTELPIFASGDLDVPQATKHDLEAILRFPGWVKLNYKKPSSTGREWYKSHSVCAGSSKTIHCHEFPFFSTQQGGGSAKPRPSLKLIDGVQNLRQGGKLSRFYAACGVHAGVSKPFLNVPMPPGSNVPTLILCNGNS